MMLLPDLSHTLQTLALSSAALTGAVTSRWLESLWSQTSRLPSTPFSLRSVLAPLISQLSLLYVCLCVSVCECCLSLTWCWVTLLIRVQNGSGKMLDTYSETRSCLSSPIDCLLTLGLRFLVLLTVECIPSLCCKSGYNELKHFCL